MVLGDGPQLVGSGQRAEDGLWDLVLGVTWLPPRGVGSGAAGNAAVSALAISVRWECKAALGCLGAGSKMVPTCVCGYFWRVKFVVPKGPTAFCLLTSKLIAQWTSTGRDAQKSYTST